jgi:hypothetical protein
MPLSASSVMIVLVIMGTLLRLGEHQTSHDLVNKIIKSIGKTCIRSESGLIPLANVAPEGDPAIYHPEKTLSLRDRCRSDGFNRFHVSDGWRSRRSATLG